VGGSKKKYQPLADFAACYGVAALGKLDYPAFCGLAFNVDRIETRMSNRVRLGILAAFSSRLDRTWFDALADAPDEADAMHNRHLAAVAVQMNAAEA
jgi:hypothetical protein